MNKLNSGVKPNVEVRVLDAVQIVGINPTKKKGSDGMNILAVPFNTGGMRDRADGGTIHAWSHNVAKRWVRSSAFSSLKVCSGNHLPFGYDATYEMANHFAMNGNVTLAERYFKMTDGVELLDLNQCLKLFKKSAKTTNKYGQQVLKSSTHTWLVYGYQIVPMWYFERPEQGYENVEPQAFTYTLNGVTAKGEGFCRNIILPASTAEYVKRFDLVNLSEEELAAIEAKSTKQIKE